MHGGGQCRDPMRMQERGGALNRVIASSLAIPKRVLTICSLSPWYRLTSVAALTLKKVVCIMRRQ